MNLLLTLAGIAALATGCAVSSPHSALPPLAPAAAELGGPPDPGAAIAAELGFHGPVERPARNPGD